MMQKILLVLFMFPWLAISQSTNQNYIKTSIYKQPTTTSDVSKANAGVIYYDGLGRPIQKIAGKASSLGTDMITHIEYDSFGREGKNYLSYPASDNLQYNSDALSSTLAFYTLSAENETTNYPYSEKFFENSPLDRVLKQSAPGDAWKGNASDDLDNTIKFAYLSNTATEVKKLKAVSTWNVTTGLFDISFVSDGNYSAGTLYKTITQDENKKATIYLGILNNFKTNTVEEFKDTDGRLLLKRTFVTLVNGWVTSVQTINTYYVYDQYGNLTYVLPPIASGVFSDELCYQYKYDGQNRLVEKKIPGKDWEYIVYDKMDRVVANGPAYSPFGGNSTGWSITKYDAFGRVAYTGWLTAATFSSATRKAMQNNTFSTVTRTTSSQTIDNIAVNYITNFPTGITLLSVNYYDSYGFPGGPLAYPSGSISNVKGLLVGNWTRVLTVAGEYLGNSSYTIYDYKSRPIKTYTKNYLGGFTQTDNSYDFAGKTLFSITAHKRLNTSVQTTVRDDYSYNPQDLLLSHTHKINSNPSELMSFNTYSYSGSLVSKKVGGSDITGVSALQFIDYTYNIRGWLKTINSTGRLAQINAPQDLFGYRINYNEAIGSNAEGKIKPLFNGNIAEISWRTTSDNMLRRYGFTYDDINRLTDAWYQLPLASTAIRNSYNEHLTYDSNGNITTLKRNGESDTATTVIAIDDLNYTYDTTKKDRLLKVIDATNHPKGFKDSADNNVDDFQYDNFGNLTADRNKGIISITYNHLNLPTQINFSGGQEIKYFYTASGEKVKKVVNNGATTTEYLSGFQYTNGTLDFFPTAGGYVKASVNPDTGSMIYNYIYNYVDHLGNVRVSYMKDPAEGILKIVDENHYYPFGLKHNGYSSSLQFLEAQTRPPYVVLTPVTNESQATYKYKYNGKELQDELGLGIYDYGARNYDPAIGRWMNIDPLAETSRRFSSYTYCYNNPLRFIDPDGMQGEDTFKLDKVGNITKIDEKKYYDSKGVEVDKLVAGDPTYDKDGNLENKNIDVKDGVLDNQKSFTTTDDKGNAVNGNSLDFGNNYGSAKKTFEFIANNSDVEFTFLNISNPDNISVNKNLIFTSHQKDKEYFGGQAALRYAGPGLLKEHNHNHPLWSAGLPSPSDLKIKSRMTDATNTYKNNNPSKKVNETKFNIYYGGNYYNY